MHGTCFGLSCCMSLWFLTPLPEPGLGACSRGQTHIKTTSTLGRLSTLCMHSAPNTFRSCADYAAITYDNVYTMASPCFWRLHPHELLVVQMRLRSLPPSSTTAQLPLHLPHTAASEPWIMLMVTLIPGMLYADGHTNPWYAFMLMVTITPGLDLC